MNDMPRSVFAGPGIMLFSAAIFGYFGFSISFNSTSAATGQYLLFVDIIGWTIRGSAVGFLLSAVLTFVNPFGGNLLYALVGLVGAVGLVVGGVLDILDTQHMVMSPVLLFVFAAWNGYGSWTALAALLAWQRADR